MARRTTPRQPRPVPAPACPCGLPAAYGDCCGRLHAGGADAPTAEALMRSRYAAFAVQDAAYLLRTWHPDTRPRRIDADPALRWEGLEIRGTTDGSPLHSEGTVAFTARYRRSGRTGELRERSRFVRHEGRWVYLDGEAGG